MPLLKWRGEYINGGGDMKGWISLHRKLMDNPLWSDPNYLKLWVYCLFEASHKDREQLVGNEIINLKRGQFITGRNSLSDEMNRGVKPKQRLNNRTWFRYLQNLETWGMLTIKSTNKFSVVTIDKYDEYQNAFNRDVQQNDHQMSSSCPSNDHQMSTNNNVNNVNNDLFSSSSDPEFSEVMNFYQSNLQRGLTESPYNLELLNQFYGEFGHDLLLASMKTAAKAEAKGINFVEGVLKNWREAGVKTIDDARKYELEFKSNHGYKKNNSNVVNIKGGTSSDERDYVDSVGVHGIKLYK